MSFVEWKQRSKLFGFAIHNAEKWKASQIERACEASYKAGKREVKLKNRLYNSAEEN